MLTSLKAYFAKRSPTTEITSRYYPPEDNLASETRILITLPLTSYPGCCDDIAFGALRHAHPSVQPNFQAHVSAVISIPGDSSHVAGRRRFPHWWAWSQWQWKNTVDENDFAEIADYLDRRAKAANTYNRKLAVEMRAHPVNIRAVEQMHRQAAVLANLPTADVDRFLAEHMGHSYERQAGWGSSTRTKRRKEARQIMSS